MTSALLLPASRGSAATSLAAAALVGSVVGVATAYGQFWLPEDLGSLANSSGSWCAVAVAIASFAPRRDLAAATGALALLGLLSGYVLGAASRGDPSSDALVVFWGLAALTAGPVLGIAACALRHGSPHRAAVGIGVISGVLAGEGVYGLVLVSETTSPPFWWGQIAVSVVVLAIVAVKRLRRASAIALACATTGAVAAAFVTVYSLDLITLLG